MRRRRIRSSRRNRVLLGLSLALAVNGAAGAAQPEGRVAGVVRILGRLPALPPRPIRKDADACGHASLPENSLVCDASGGVRDAVVTLAGGPPAPPSPEPATIHQKGCDYEPHILVLPSGSRLKIVNDDDLLHNVHAYDEKGETLFNFAQPFKGIANTATLRKPGVVRLVCDTGHAWMRGFVVVTDSRYRAVTGPDGTFAFENVPSGEYTAILFHETLGRKELRVTVPPGGERRVAFELSPPPDSAIR